MQLPRHGGEGVLGLFDEDEPSDRTAPLTIPQCIYCAKATLRTDAAGRPAHEPCEPRDVGLTDPETSRTAAATARKGTRSPLARMIYKQLVAAGPMGMTDDELCDALTGQPAGSISKRRLDLCRAGRVEETMERRLSRWGKPSIVWRASFPEDPL